MFNITQDDLNLVLQKNLNYSLKIEVLTSSGNVLETLYGMFTGGSSSIDANSEIRRTFSVTITPTLTRPLNISEDGILWLDKELHLYLGIRNMRTGKDVFYSQGYYVFTNTNGSYDATTNQISIECSDRICYLDGTKNGQIGALTTIIPAYEENNETGEITKYNIIRESFIQVLTQLGKVSKYMIDDIGEINGLSEYNDDYLKYREQHPLWNTIPYDLEFSAGCSVFSILQEIRDLYPNFEMFFDEEGIFRCQLIPSLRNDNIIFSNDFLQKILISESSTLDMSSVRNICEVWGKVIDADFMAESSTLSGINYSCSIDSYDEYKNRDKIALKISTTNPDNVCLKINNLNAIPVYDENTDLPLEKNHLEINTVYVFEIKTVRVNDTNTFRAYLLGHWQAHGLNVLTNGREGDDYTFPDGTVAKKFSLKYFQKMYNCENVSLTIIVNSPFVVQKIGEILDVKNSGEYDNITSDSLAVARAEHENWKNSRLTDSITITTLLVPFLDVNVKVSYKKSDSDGEQQYIIKSVNQDYTNGTSTINMIKFYPLYADLLRTKGNHSVLEWYKHIVLGKYSHEELTEFIEGGEY